MALFPAYAQDVADIEIIEEGRALESSEVSPGRESKLLASDSGTDDERPVRSAIPRPPSQPEDFYWDTKSDYGNLRVSTLYYPGRPQYALSAKWWGHGRGGVGGGGGAVVPSVGRSRYYHVQVRDEPAHAETHARAAAYRRMLHDTPADHVLWLKYIDFQEQWFDGEAALRAAEEATGAVCGAGAGARALRCELQRLRATHLPRDSYLGILRDELAAAQCRPAEESLQWWARLGAARGAEGARPPALAAAALSRLAHVSSAYPQLLYIHGATLRAAGLWEQLVLMMELVTAMNFPPAGFPPPHDAARAQAIEDNLLATEEKAVRSGLPVWAVWARVERARAAAHWRGARTRDVDPQRRPLPADVADLLLPVVDDHAAFLLCLNLLRLAKVPLMPHAEYVSRACGVSGLTEEEVGGSWWCDGAEALLAMVRAARRLPPAHPAHPAHPRTARSLLAHFLDPPHYFTDDTGFLSWVTCLWEACCGWVSGARRVALVCWRLRWMHSLVLLLDVSGGEGGEEARRVRGEARAVLERHAGDSPLPYAQYARVERVVSGRRRAAAVAERALRAALADPDCPVTHRLYVARVLREVCDADGVCGAEEGGGEGAVCWAVPCAVLGRALPPAGELRARPRPDARVLHAALQLCEERCAELEAQFRAGAGGGAGACAGGGAGACAALLPGAGEWCAARVALSPPHARATLLQELPTLYEHAMGSVEGARYYEQCACALVTARDPRLGRGVHALAELFPHSALLAAAQAGAPLWSRGVMTSHTTHPPARTHTTALALLLPPLLRAVAADWAPRESERVRAWSSRVSRGGRGGALVCVAALEGAARGDRPDAAATVLLSALNQHPDHKWLYVRGASWVPAEAETLADVLLERQLRVHVLRDELAPPQHDTQHDSQHDPQHDQRHDPQHDSQHDPQHDQRHDLQHDSQHDPQHA